MPKPIAVITIRFDQLYIRGQKPNYLELQEAMESKLPDYHVFALEAGMNQEELMTFQIFYEKDFTDIQYDELKSLVEEQIKKPK